MKCETITKECLKCNKIIPLSNFHRKTTSKDGRQPLCKECDYKARNQHYQKNKQLHLEKQRERLKPGTPAREKYLIYLREYREKNKLKMFYTHIKYKYGISREQYELLFKQQNGCCAICEKSQEQCKYRLHVDHNHDSNIIRGLLCNDCNCALGLFKEQPLILQKAILYLEKSSNS